MPHEQKAIRLSFVTLAAVLLPEYVLALTIVLVRVPPVAARALLDARLGQLGLKGAGFWSVLGQLYQTEGTRGRRVDLEATGLRMEQREGTRNFECMTLELLVFLDLPWLCPCPSARHTTAYSP